MLDNLHCSGKLKDSRPCLKLLARTSLEKFGTVEIKCKFYPTQRVGSWRSNKKHDKRSSR